MENLPRSIHGSHFLPIYGKDPGLYMTETAYTPCLSVTLAFQKRFIRQMRPKVSRIRKTQWIQKGQHSMLKRFLRAHPGFNRDDIQDYLNFFSFIASNPEEETLEKVKILLELVFDNPKILRYRG